MKQKEPTQLTDQELLQEAKKNKTSPITDAVLIGFMAGIIIYSVVANTWGLVTLVPLFLIYGLIKKSKKTQA